MKFQIISDLHLESYNKLPKIRDIITPKAPNLILAGDICFIKHPFFIPFFQKLSPLFKKIIYIFGNHEYYIAGDYQIETIAAIEMLARKKLSPFKNIHILQKSFIKLDDIVILGCTLWSYLSKKDFVYGMQMLSASSFVRHNNTILLHPSISNELYFNHKAWLKDMLEVFGNKKVIVVTHYLPTIKAIDNKYTIFNKSYYSNCDNLVERATIWCCGHTHDQKIIHVGETPLYINAVGRKQERKNEPYNMIFII